MYSLPVEIQVAHRVLNLILVKLRWLVSADASRDQLYDIVDRIEALPTLLSCESDVREFFEHVQALAAAYPEFQLAIQEANRQSSAVALG